MEIKSADSLIYTYLPSDREEDFALKVHEIDFVASNFLVVIDAINDLTIRIKNRAAIPMEDE